MRYVRSPSHDETFFIIHLSGSLYHNLGCILADAEEFLRPQISADLELYQILSLSDFISSDGQLASVLSIFDSLLFTSLLWQFQCNRHLLTRSEH